MLKIPPPRHWQDFEHLCWDLCRSVWKDENPQRFGRSGQKQHGVDIVVHPTGRDNIVGIQCKVTEALSASEANVEIEEAKTFTPKLTEYVIATTAPRDKQLQQFALEATARNEQQGHFSVQVWSWDDILELLENYQEVRDRFLRGAIPGLAETEVASKLTLTTSQQIERVATAVIGQTISQLSSGPDSEALLREYDAELETAKQLMKSRHYARSIVILESLQVRLSLKAPPRFRYRLMSNIASCKLAMNDLHAAGTLLVDALNFQPEDEAAQCNAAAGHLLMGDIETGKRLAEAVLKGNPVSAQAIAIRIQCAQRSESCRDLEALVPDSLRTNAAVCQALGQAAMEREVPSDAIRWLRCSIATDPENPDCKAALAEALIKDLTNGSSTFRIGRRDSRSNEQLREALTLVGQAWDAVAQTDQRSVRVTWLGFRSFIKNLLGDFDGALADIETACSIDPQDSALKKNKAVALLDGGRIAQAIEILREKRVRAEIPGASILLADVLRKQGSASEAVGILEELMLSASGQVDQALAGDLLFDIFIEIKHREKAKTMAARLDVMVGDKLPQFLRSARIMTLEGNEGESRSTLLKAIQSITPLTPLEDLASVGNELYNRKMYVEALPIYARLVPSPGDDVFSRRLLNVYYSLGRLKDALNLAETIETQVGLLPFSAHIQVAIYDEMGDLKSAERVCSGYVANHKSDLRMAIGLAWIQQQLGKYGDVDAFLANHESLEGIPESDIQQLVALFVARGAVPAAAKLLYEACRRHGNNPDFQVQFFMLMLFMGKHLEETLKVTDTAAGTAVQVRYDDGRTAWHLIEVEQVGQREASVLYPKDPLALKLLGHTAGDTIVLREDELTRETVTLLEVKHRYVHLLHDIMESFTVRFPQDKRLYSFHVGDPEQLKELPAPIRKVLELREKQGNSADKALALYRQGALPIGAFAKLVGKDVVEVYEIAVRNENVGIVCGSGQVDEIEGALTLLSRADVTAVLDLTALLTLSRVGFSYALRSGLQLAVVQFTIETLQRATTTLEMYGERERGSIFKVGPAIVMQQESPEESTALRKRLREALEWIALHCRVLPCTAALDIPREQKRERDDLLGEASHESVLVAQGELRVLWSDDFSLRRFAKSLSVNCVWSQPVFINAARKGALPGEEYHRSCARLIELNYKPVFFTAQTILLAARDSGWSSSSTFQAVCGALSGREMRVDTFKVAFEALVGIIDAPAVPFQVDLLIQILMEAVAKGRDRRIVYGAFIRAVRDRYALQPIVQKRIIDLLGLLSKHLKGDDHKSP